MEQIKSLITKRAKLWHEAQEILDRAETQQRDLNNEEDAQFGRLNDDMNELDARIKDLEKIRERRAEHDAQRERFERAVKPQDRVGEDDPRRDMENKVRAWLRGQGPRHIELKLTGDVKEAFQPDSRTGIQRRFEQRDLSKLTAGAGGNVVPVGFIPRLYEHLVEEAALRQTNVGVYTTDSGENLLVPKTTAHSAAVLVAEAAAIPESDPAFGQQTLLAYKYGVMIQVSNELATDSGIDLLAYLARQSGRALGQASGAHFITGTGTNQPEGVSTNVTTGKVGTTGQTTTVIADDLIDLYHSLVSGYRGRGWWLMNDSSLAKVRKLKDTTGQFIWQPGLQAGQPDLLLGRPVVTDPTVAVMAANAKSILFGDFSAYYAIRDVSGVRFERSDDFAFANDLISFRALIRTDGKPLDATAVKAYVNSAT